MTDDPGSLPPAGWYPDPADRTGRRYWDGHHWTEHTLASGWDRPPAAAPEAESSPQSASWPAAGQDLPGSPSAPEPQSSSPSTDQEPALEAAPVPEAQPDALARPTPESVPASAPEPHAESPSQPAQFPPESAAAGPRPIEAQREPEPASDHPESGPGAAPGWPQPEPAVGWMQPGFSTGGPGAAPPYPGHEAYVPQTAPLTATGMRRVPAMFSDMGRILKRAWWQIALISLAVWIAWSLIATALLATLFDFGRFTEALNLAVSAANDYPSGRYPEALADEIRESFEAVPRTTSVGIWVLVVGVVVLLYGLAASLQVAAVNRLGMDAAAGRPIRLGSAVRSGALGGIRLFGYYLLFTVLILAVALIVVLLMAATSSVPPLLALIVMLVIAGSIVGALFFIGRLAPITAQVAVSRGALGWSWRATRTKFWGVLGRYLLWALVAGVIGQVVLSIVSIPLFLFSTASLSGSPMEITPAIAVTWVIMMVLSLVISAITYVGIVPIWRDLTDDPEYRSIADGQPLPDPV